MTTMAIQMLADVSGRLCHSLDQMKLQVIQYMKSHLDADERTCVLHKSAAVTVVVNLDGAFKVACLGCVCVSNEPHIEVLY